MSIHSKCFQLLHVFFNAKIRSQTVILPKTQLTFSHETIKTTSVNSKCATIWCSSSSAQLHTLLHLRLVEKYLRCARSSLLAPVIFKAYRKLHSVHVIIHAIGGGRVVSNKKCESWNYKMIHYQNHALCSAHFKSHVFSRRNSGKFHWTLPSNSVPDTWLHWEPLRMPRCHCCWWRSHWPAQWWPDPGPRHDIGTDKFRAKGTNQRCRFNWNGT